MEPTGDEVEHRLQLGLPAIGQVSRYTARADEVVVHAQSGDELKEAKGFFAFAPAIQHHADGAKVHPVGGEKQHVGAEPVDLAQQRPDPGGPLGHLDAQQFLGGERKHGLVKERTCIVHARDVGGALQVGELFAGLLHAGVEVADHRTGATNDLTLQLEHHSQHPVGGRVLRPEVHDHVLVVGQARVLLGLRLGHAQYVGVLKQFGAGRVQVIQIGTARIVGLGRRSRRCDGGHQASLNCTGISPTA